MAKFIVLTYAGSNARKLVLNVDKIEYMIPRANGTELFTITNHTKYAVKESLDDILSRLDDLGMVTTIAQETSPVTEVKENEDHSVQ